MQSARAGEKHGPREIGSGGTQGDVVREARRQVSFIGGPDAIAEQLNAFRDRCGLGVVDLAFQQPSIDRGEVMKEIELFGREVLPRIKEF